MELLVSVQEEANALFQGTHNSPCQGRRQCDFATHSPVHSKSENKEPVHSPEDQGQANISSRKWWPLASSDCWQG